MRVLGLKYSQDIRYPRNYKGILNILRSSYELSGALRSSQDLKDSKRYFPKHSTQNVNGIQAQKANLASSSPRIKELEAPQQSLLGFLKVATS